MRRPEVLLAVALVVATVAIAVFATSGPGTVRPQAPAAASVVSTPTEPVPAGAPEPEMIVVPDLVAAWHDAPYSGSLDNGDKDAAVRRQAEQLGLRAEVELCFSMAGHGGDTQEPAPGARVTEGTTVRLHIELGGE